MICDGQLDVLLVIILSLADLPKIHFEWLSLALRHHKRIFGGAKTCRWFCTSSFLHKDSLPISDDCLNRTFCHRIDSAYQVPILALASRALLVFAQVYSGGFVGSVDARKFRACPLWLAGLWWNTWCDHLRSSLIVSNLVDYTSIRRWIHEIVVGLDIWPALKADHGVMVVHVIRFFRGQMRLWPARRLNHFQLFISTDNWIIVGLLLIVEFSRGFVHMRLGPVFISATTLINFVGSDHMGTDLLLHGGRLNVKIYKLLTVRIHHHILDVEIGACHKSLH